MREMRRTRGLLILSVLLLAAGVGWLWWAKPRKVDMTTYAPANSLLYLESNRPLDVLEAIADTDTWKAVANLSRAPQSPSRSQWFQRFVGWTGIGPIESVVLARAQVAVIVTDLGTIEEGDTLRIKPEGAVIIETHTAERRIQTPFEESLKRLAEVTYGKPTSRRTTIDGVEFIEWTAPEGSRQLIGAIVGSLVIVGNTERAVQSCVKVYLRRAPSLKDDPELHRARLQLAGDQGLTFGYVPTENSARLLSVGVPLLMGLAPGDSDFQRLITAGASKVFGSLAWTSYPYRNGIEDRYLISLQPSIVTRLKPNFSAIRATAASQRVLPEDVYSVTYYKFENPVAAWQSLKSAVSSQIDALSAVVFSSLLRSALQPFGIDEPEKFLAAVNGDVITLRLDQSSERSLLLAGVRDRTSLRELFIKRSGVDIRSDRVGEAEILEDTQGETALSFIDDFVVMGSPSDVRGYSENARARGTMMSDEKLRRVTFFVPLSSSATILTYTNDEARVRSFISAIVDARGGPPLEFASIEKIMTQLPYSATETRLGERGIERVTRSPLGQFSTLLPLLVPEKSGQTANLAPSE
jgi:hypothetical protein